MKRIILKYAIILCWISLITCFIIKLLGGNWFEIVINSPNFVKVCNWLDTSWTKYILTSILYMYSMYAFYLIMTTQTYGKDLWYLIICLPISYLKGNYPAIGLVFDIFILIVIPFIKLLILKNNPLICIVKVVLANGYLIILQLVSIFVRNIGIKNVSDSMSVGLFLQIDYYIMIILTYLYMCYYKRKETQFASNRRGWKCRIKTAEGIKTINKIKAVYLYSMS